MPSTRARNRQIVALHQSGESFSTLAGRFGISRARAKQIVDAARKAEERERRVHGFRERLLATDDLDREWSVAELVEGLGVPLRFQDPLVYYFSKRSGNDISLREFMALVVSDKPRPTGFFGRNPVLGANGIGLRALRHILEALTSMDMGETCNREWRRRLGILAKHGGLRTRL